MNSTSSLLRLPIACLVLSSFAAAQGADDCTMASTITGNGPFAFDTTAATTDGLPDPLCLNAGSDEIFNDVWFSWTASDDGDHIVSLCNNSTGDTRIGIYDGTCAGPIVACNDDSCGLISEVTFPATMGQTYLIRVGNFGATGFATGEMSIQLDAPIFNPNNGHYYRLVNEQLPWNDARIAAESMTFQGQTGHLVTLSDQAELDWILQNIAPGRPWIGLSQNTQSTTYSEPAGGYEWVTGEPLTFTSWAAGEPSDTSASGGSEEYVEMFASGEWNDAEEAHIFTTQYLVEYEMGGLGMNYCMANPNSVGTIGTMSALGSRLASDNDVTLIASSIPNFSFGFFITSQVQGFIPTPNGSQGNLCLTGAIGRYVAPGQIQNSGNDGQIELAVDLTMTPQPNGLVTVLAGQTWNFQLWHRDTVMGSASSNFTDGLAIGFL